MPYIRISRLGDVLIYGTTIIPRRTDMIIVTGVGLDPFELEREAGYNIGATTKD